MDLIEYEKLIASWREKYGVPPPKPESFNLTSIRVCCKRCGETRPRMHRHHKRNDLFFARLLPDIYAARYIEFNPEDVDRLCEECHENIHKYWRPAHEQMLAELHDLRHNKLKEPDEAWCEYWRALFYEWYMTWLSTKYRRRKRHADGF